MAAALLKSFDTKPFPFSVGGKPSPALIGVYGPVAGSLETQQ